MIGNVSIVDMNKIGLTSNHCPVTHQCMPNLTRNFDQFHISYCGYMQHYGSDTTALVLRGRVFLILNGYHADAMIETAVQYGVAGCIQVFMDRISSANRLSEHLIAVGLSEDRFGLQDTTLDLLGKQVVGQMRKVFITNSSVQV